MGTPLTLAHPNLREGSGGGGGEGGHAPQLEDLSGDIHRTLSAFASCAPAPFTLNDAIEERDSYGPGSHGSARLASLTPQLPAERISELRFAMVALAVPDLNSVVVEWANRRPALWWVRALRASPGSPRLGDLERRPASREGVGRLSSPGAATMKHANKYNDDDGYFAKTKRIHT